MFQLILQNIRKHKAQTVSVLVSVVITAAVVVALALVYAGVTRGMETSRARLGADVIVVPDEAADAVSDADLLFTGAAIPYYLPASAVDEVASTKWVGRVTAQFFVQTLSSSSCCTTGLEARVIGVDASTDWVVSPWMQESIVGQLEPDEVVVGSGIVLSDGATTLRVLGQDFEIATVLDATGTSLDYSLIMDIDTARELARSNENYAHLWERNGDPGELVTAILVDLDEDVDPSRVSTVVSMIEHKSGGTAISASSALESVQSQMDTVFALMLGAAILLAIASIVQLVARFYTMTWDRRAEFGLYRALGARRQTLRHLISGEMALLVGGGSVVGALVGYGLYRAILAFLSGQGAFPFVAPSALAVAGVMLAVVVALLVIGLLSILVPLGQIAKISPTHALVRGNID